MPADSSQPSVEARRHATPARCAITRLRLLAVVVFLVCVVGVTRLVTHSTKVGPAVRAHRFHVAQSGDADFAGDGDALVGAGSIRAAPSPNSVVQAARAEAARILEQARTEEAQLLQQADSLGCDCFEQPPGTQPVDGSPRFVEVACPDGCSGHGRCKDLYCHCDEGWGGTGCWTETPKRLSLGEAISFVLVPTRADECVANAMRALYVLLAVGCCVGSRRRLSVTRRNPIVCSQTPRVPHGATSRRSPPRQAGCSRGAPRLVHRRRHVVKEDICRPGPRQGVLRRGTALGHGVVPVHGPPPGSA